MYTALLLALLGISAAILINGVKQKNKSKAAVGIILGLLTAGFFWFMGFWSEVLWFDSLGFNDRFWLEISYSLISGLVGIIIAFAGTYLLTLSIPKNFKYVKWAAVIIASFSGATWGYSNWNVILQFLNSVPTTVTDPVFGYTTGFYLFTLPFLDIIYVLLFTISFLSFAASVVASFVRMNPEGVFFYLPPAASESTKHLHNALYLNSSVFLFVLAFGKFLDKFHLMYSSSGVVFGPGWADVNILIPAYNIIVLIMILMGIVLLVPSLRGKYRNIFNKFKIDNSNAPVFIVGGTAVFMILIWFIGLSVIPGLFESFIVKPNEITYERPYIQNNIKFTRFGFGLDKVKEKEFPESGTFTMQTVKNNPAIFKNIRLWDWRALDATYRQFQGFRLYYQFSSVDIDRYKINGIYRQVMLSAREMDLNNLPQQSQTFVNRRFQYTHGYGITMSTVNEFTPQGLPHLLIKDIPIQSVDSSLNVTQPRIYYGELTNTPVVVNSKQKEFDYPNGNKNVYNRYNGKGGVLINSLWRKFLFGWNFDGTQLLFSDYPTQNSRIMFHRQIMDRVRMLAPFLKFDKDPYIVLNKGKLYWMLDAYTASDYYPYSEPFTANGSVNFLGSNYIRNSVKVVIDAYNGDVNFYVVNKNDPLINVWNKIYPGLFKPESAMDKGLVEHIRYPQDMLLAQGLVYQKYHMTDPTVFYNQEDLWVRATEKYYSNIQPVEPYYIIWQLPGSDKPQFSLILPFTPKNRQVLIGWIAGMCDPDNYGELITYQFPKGKMITGPQQVETKIDQDSFLSGQLTLWDQRGSKVIRGNVLAIPVANTLFYVEPIYLQAETAAYPELRLVVVMHGDDMSYAQTFDQALNKFFSTPGNSPVTQTTTNTESTTKQNNIIAVQDLIKQANNAFNNYLKYNGQKKFNEAAKELEKLQQTLNKLSGNNGKK